MGIFIARVQCAYDTKLDTDTVDNSFLGKVDELCSMALVNLWCVMCFYFSKCFLVAIFSRLMQKRGKPQSRKGTSHQPLPEASEPEARKAGILLSGMFAAAFCKGGIEGRETGISLPVLRKTIIEEQLKMMQNNKQKWLLEGSTGWPAVWPYYLVMTVCVSWTAWKRSDEAVGFLVWWDKGQNVHGEPTGRVSGSLMLL